VSELAGDRPLLALHIGNFVGVSLAYLSDVLRAIHPGSRIFSIDPNITHRGVVDPARHAFALLGHFGLSELNVVITGYTLERNVGDDSELDPAETHAAEQRCEQVLPNLAAVVGRRFDLVLIDGNHDGRYLTRELEQVRRLLRPHGLLVVDDVDETEWRLVAETFDCAAASGGFDELGRDGRIGVLRHADPVRVRPGP
jgi:predicted O-methyltransferase YrrM